MATRAQIFVLMLVLSGMSVAMGLGAVSSSRVAGWRELELTEFVGSSFDLDTTAGDGKSCRLHCYYDDKALSTHVELSTCFVELASSIDSLADDDTTRSNTYYGASSDASCVFVCKTYTSSNDSGSAPNKLLGYSLAFSSVAVGLLALLAL